MTLGQKLEHNRAARDTARAALEDRVDQVRQDLADRGIGERIADKVTAGAAEAANEAADIVRTNKPVVAGTLLALIVWGLRHRIAALIRGGDPDDFRRPDEQEPDEQEKEWNS